MLSNAINQLQEPSAIGVIPTDTVYGVVARAGDQVAVARLYQLKGRESSTSSEGSNQSSDKADKPSRPGKPGTIIAADLKQLETLGLKHRYLTAVEQFWPGAVSVVIPASDPALRYLHQGKQALAVRIPDHPELQKLLERTGPLLTSSANHPDKPPATTIQQARVYFGNGVDFYVDGGDLSDHQPSTIIRVVDDAIEILRPGAVKINAS
jgi:L-threonylcarbamoyladenylate synthase